MKQIFSSILDKSASADLVALVALKKWRGAFIWACALGVLGYFIFISNFLLDGHYPRMPWIDSRWMIGRGNFLAPAVNQLFYNANIPVFTPVVAILLLGISGVLTCFLLTEKRSAFLIFLCASFLILFPFQITVFYYSFSTQLFSLAQLLAVLGVFLAFHAHSRWWLCGSALLIFAAMSVYQPAISIAITLLFAKIAFELSKAEKPWEHIASIALPALAIVSGGLLYALVASFLGGGAAALDSRSFYEVIAGAPTVIRSSFFHLWATQPELLRPVKSLLLVPFISIAILQMLHGRFVRSLMVITSLVFAVIGTKALFFISTDTNFFIYRYNFSLGFLYLAAFVLAFDYVSRLNYKKTRRAANFALSFVMVIVLVLFIQANLVRQHILLRGVQHDMALLNRIITRVEQIEELDISKRYTFVIWPGLPNIRAQLFSGNEIGPSYDLRGGQHLNDSVPANWNPETALRLLGSNIKAAPYLPQRAQVNAQVRQILADRDVQPWPHESSVFIEGDLIIVVMR